MMSFFFLTQVSLQTALYSWVCRMLHEISYQIINLHVYAISGQNRASEIPVTLAAQGMV
jgi:hypothetical protein